MTIFIRRVIQAPMISFCSYDYLMQVRLHLEYLYLENQNENNGCKKNPELTRINMKNL